MLLKHSKLSKVIATCSKLEGLKMKLTSSYGLNGL